MPALLPTENLAELLHRVFGHREFRAHQRKVCEAATAGRDVLLVMPTGAGKSLCYQLPALARGATALVISPLIALMDDQASKLAQLGLRVARIHSGLPRDDARQACRDYLKGELDFLFIAPERMRVPGFPEMLARRKPGLVAIDEAHCISAWGHDFRPDYRTLGQHLTALRPAPVIALTATATPTVQRDIALQLDLRDPAVFITGFRRENLAVQAVELSKPERAEFTAQLLADPEARPAIVYAASRKSAEELAARLNTQFPAQAYHAGLEPSVRERVQREFLAGAIDVVVATIAFGMGVDKPDVRTVVHVALPGSVEAFYQEIGRAGRDGFPSRSVLLYSFADRKTLEFFIERDYPPASDLDRVARLLGDEFTSVDDLEHRLKLSRAPLDRETLQRRLDKLIAAGVAVAERNGDVRGTGENSWKTAYEAQVTSRKTQVDRMVAFAEGHKCRMTALVHHFGDTSDNQGPCGQCDICRPVESAAGAGGHAPDDDERQSLRAILKAIEHRGQSTGKLFTELQLCRERASFDVLLEGLARAGLLTIENDSFRTPEGRDVTYRKAIITHEGRTPDDATLDTVWIHGPAEARVGRSRKSGKSSRTATAAKSGSRTTKPATSRAHVARSQPSGGPRPSAARQPAVPVAAPSPLAGEPRRSGSLATPQTQRREAAPAAPLELSPQQLAMEERLKLWRREEAARAGLPSFFIFSDTTLRHIVLAGAVSLPQLRSVHGVGVDKLERFGEAVLHIMRG